jgi:predicted component of viral defense system (DUF524 family)
MAMSSAANLPLRNGSGATIGNLLIAALPNKGAPQDRSDDPSRPRNEPAVQLREASAYRYSLDLGDLHRVTLEPSELFDPDDPSGMAGRLSTRQYVGDVLLTALDTEGEEIGSAPILVKAAKLEHATEYQRMLRDIADLASEAVLQGFAPASASTSIASARPPRLQYQQFAILQARLADEELQDAIAWVIHRPHREWVREIEWRPPGRPLRVGGEVARALTGPGPRVPAGVALGALDTLPGTIESHRGEETVDTVPNRFVKFALAHWRELAARLGDILASRASAAYGVRGTAAVDRAVEALDDVLSEPFFRQIGRLQELPTSNQVLLKREGYRQIFSTFALIESSLDLRLELDDAIHPSQRNIASLYEYWTFLKLVEAVGDACDDDRAPLRLFQQDGDGLSLGLKRGKQSKLRWTVSVAARRLAVSVYFNRTFRSVDERATDGSWSRAMIPDASVRIRPVDGRTRVEGDRDLDVWLHFDAKYKLDWSSSQFERVRPEHEEQTALAEEEHERTGNSRREDLLKMHAYRDAIRRSAGAYVLFPGTSKALEFSEYEELIPGLGAFPLRPGSGAGPAALSRFVRDVLRHAASQGTAEERSRYWQARILDEQAGPGRSAVEFLDRPPADTLVLICDVPDQRYWQWTDELGQYFVRLGQGDDGIKFRAEELAAPLVLLSGKGRAAIFQRRGPWTVVDEHDLLSLRYPSPSGGPGLLCRLIPIREQPPWLHELPLTDLLAAARRPGEPVLIEWSRMVQPEVRAAPRPSRPVPPTRRAADEVRRRPQPGPASATPLDEEESTADV